MDDPCEEGCYHNSPADCPINRNATVKYDQTIAIPCDLSLTSLVEAALSLGPSFTYELRVHPMAAVWARHLIRKIGAATEDHPFAPCINIVERTDYGQTEWSVHSLANGRSMGTIGC